MPDEMTVLKTFLSDLEAEIALNRLTALGVTAAVFKDNCGGMRPHLELQGVQLVVAESDLAKARGILAESADSPQDPDWLCPECAEKIEGNFDTCWQCGYQRV